MLVGGGGNGRYFDKDKEVVYWCGARNLWQEEFLGDVSVWVRK